MPAPFTIDFTAPDAPSNVNAVGFKILRAPDADAAKITWTPVDTPPENLIRQELWANDGVEWIRIASWNDPAVHEYIYPFPRSRKLILYQLNQIVRSGSLTRTGLWGSDTLQLDINHISLVSINAPHTRRVEIMAWPDAQEVLTQNQDWHYPAGGRNPIELPGSLRGRDIPLSAQLFDRTDGITAEQTWDDFKTLFDTRDIFCTRYPRGGKWFSRFNGNVTNRYGKGGVRSNIDFAVRQVAYDESVIV
jgi:hypothetical protein